MRLRPREGELALSNVGQGQVVARIRTLPALEHKPLSRRHLVHPVPIVKHTATVVPLVLVLVLEPVVFRLFIFPKSPDWEITIIHNVDISGKESICSEVMQQY